jgi:hypothetical protein
MKKILVPAVLAIAALVAASSAARAAEAFTTTAANVRSGPGTNYAVIGTLPAGVRVHLEYCQRNWCRIDRASLHGWTSASLLDWDDAGVEILPMPFFYYDWPIHHPRPPHPKPWPPKPWPPHQNPGSMPPIHKPPFHKPPCIPGPGKSCP